MQPRNVNSKKRKEAEKAALKLREQYQLKKRQELEAKHRNISEKSAQWNEQILPRWSELRESKIVGELCMKGIPPSIRGKVWPLLIGNNLKITFELFQNLVALAELPQTEADFEARSPSRKGKSKLFAVRESDGDKDTHVVGEETTAAASEAPVATGETHANNAQEAPVAATAATEEEEEEVLSPRSADLQIEREWQQLRRRITNDGLAACDDLNAESSTATMSTSPSSPGKAVTKVSIELEREWQQLKRKITNEGLRPMYDTFSSQRNTNNSKQSSPEKEEGAPSSNDNDNTTPVLADRELEVEDEEGTDAAHTKSSDGVSSSGGGVVGSVGTPKKVRADSDPGVGAGSSSSSSSAATTRTPFSSSSNELVVRDSSSESRSRSRSHSRSPAPAGDNTTAANTLLNSNAIDALLSIPSVDVVAGIPVGAIMAPGDDDVGDNAGIMILDDEVGHEEGTGHEPVSPELRRGRHTMQYLVQAGLVAGTPGVPSARQEGEQGEENDKNEESNINHRHSPSSSSAAPRALDAAFEEHSTTTYSSSVAAAPVPTTGPLIISVPALQFPEAAGMLNSLNQSSANSNLSYATAGSGGDSAPNSAVPPIAIPPIPTVGGGQQQAAAAGTNAPLISPSGGSTDGGGYGQAVFFETPPRSARAAGESSDRDGEDSDRRDRDHPVVEMRYTDVADVIMSQVATAEDDDEEEFQRMREPSIAGFAAVPAAVPATVPTGGTMARWRQTAPASAASGGSYVEYGDEDVAASTRRSELTATDFVNRHRTLGSCTGSDELLRLRLEHEAAEAAEAVATGRPIPPRPAHVTNSGGGSGGGGSQSARTTSSRTSSGNNSSRSLLGGSQSARTSGEVDKQSLRQQQQDGFPPPPTAVTVTATASKLSALEEKFDNNLNIGISSDKLLVNNSNSNNNKSNILNSPKGGMKRVTSDGALSSSFNNANKQALLLAATDNTSSSASTTDNSSNKVMAPMAVKSVSKSANTTPHSPEPTSRRQSIKLIEFDIPRTFPTLAFFHDGGPLHVGLVRVLKAYACYRADVGYVQGMSYIVSMLLLYMDELQAFQSLANLLSRRGNMDFYRLKKFAIDAYVMCFDFFFKQHLPLLYMHMKNEGVTSEMYLMDWNLSMFAKALPLEVAARLWDMYLFEGEVFVTRAALGILRMYAPKLCTQSMETIMSFLINLPANVDADVLLANIDQIRISKRKFEEMRDKMTHELHVRNGTTPTPSHSSSSSSSSAQYNSYADSSGGAGGGAMERRPSGSSTSTFRNIRRAFRTTIFGPSTPSSSTPSSAEQQQQQSQSNSSHGLRTHSTSTPNVAAVGAETQSNQHQQSQQHQQAPKHRRGSTGDLHLLQSQANQQQALHAHAQQQRLSGSSKTAETSTSTSRSRTSAENQESMVQSQQGHAQNGVSNKQQQQTHQQNEYTGGAVDTYQQPRSQQHHSAHNSTSSRRNSSTREMNNSTVSPKTPSNNNSDCSIS